MNVEVELPDLGPGGGSQARVAEWDFDEGDYVEEGEILCEVVSELESVEVAAPCSGTLLERVVEEDETLRIGEVLGVIDCEEDMDASDEDVAAESPDDGDNNADENEDD